MRRKTILPALLMLAFALTGCFGGDDDGGGGDDTGTDTGTDTGAGTDTSTDTGTGTGTGSTTGTQTEAPPEPVTITGSGSGPKFGDICTLSEYPTFGSDIWGWDYTIEPSSMVAEWWKGEETLVGSGSSGQVPSGTDNVGACDPVSPVPTDWTITVTPPGYTG